MKQHNTKKIKELFKRLQSLGFRIEVKNKNRGYSIFSPIGYPSHVYYTHGTDKSYHPIRREIKKRYQIDIEKAH